MKIAGKNVGYYWDIIKWPLLTYIIVSIVLGLLPTFLVLCLWFLVLAGTFIKLDDILKKIGWKLTLLFLVFIMTPFITFWVVSISISDSLLWILLLLITGWIGWKTIQKEGKIINAAIAGFWFGLFLGIFTGLIFSGIAIFAFLNQPYQQAIDLIKRIIVILIFYIIYYTVISTLVSNLGGSIAKFRKKSSNSPKSSEK